MPSPRINITEKDNSNYTVTSSNTIAALVGFATKGPISIPTFCAGIDQFKNIFGLTPKDQPYSHLAAYKYFDQGNALWFTRIADNTAEETNARVLSNNGTGVAAKITSTNNIVNAALVSGTDYGLKIIVEVDGIEYRDTIVVNLGISTNMTELISDLNSAISSSTILNGKLLASKTLSDGNISSTDSLNVYLTFTTSSTGPEDILTIGDPDSGNSLLSNGSVGFAYSLLTAFGTFSSPTKGSLIGSVDFGTTLSPTTVDLSTNYNLNLLIDEDLTSNTVDLASKNKAQVSGNISYTNSTSTTSNGFNPARYNLNIDLAPVAGPVAPSIIDLTGDLGASATNGYQLWKFQTAIKTASSLSGLSRYTNCGFGNHTASDWLTSTSTTLTPATPYEFDLAVEGIDLGNGSGIAKSVSFTTHGSDVTIGDGTGNGVMAKIKGAIDALNAGVLVGLYSISVSTGDMVITGASTLYAKNITVAATTGIGTNLFASGIFSGLTPRKTTKNYRFSINIDGAGASNIDIDGTTDITTISGMVSAIYSGLTGASCEFVGANEVNIATNANGGTYGSLIFYSSTKGTEPSPGVTSSSIIAAAVAAVFGTNQSLSASITNLKVSPETAVDGLDEVLTQGHILSQINTAIVGKGIATFNSTNKLTITTDIEGRTGKVVLAVGSTNDALADFFESAGPITDVGGTGTTLDEIVSAINTQINSFRSTSGIVYALKYIKPADAKFYLKIQGELTGSIKAKLFINSEDGLTAAAPSNNTISTVFDASAWSVASEVSYGTNGTINSMFKFVFAEKGTASVYNSLTGMGGYIVFETEVNPLYIGPGDVTNEKYFKYIKIYYNGKLVETFGSNDSASQISFDRSDTNWFVNKINATPQNGGSEYVSVEWFMADADSLLDEDTVWNPSAPTSGTYLVPDGTIYLSGGNDGIPTGSIDALVQTGVSTFANPELYDPHLLAVPGVSSSSVITSTINFIEGSARQDILYLVDPPFGLDVQEVADWHNGKSSLSGAPAIAINSSYATLFWSWLLTYDTDNQEYTWCPPSVFVMSKLTEIDNTYKPWGIPAGLNRGKVIADNIEYSPSQAERDLIYDINGNLNVNPFVNFPGQGIFIYGQKTLLRSNSALNRLNVRRTVIYIKKLMRQALKVFMFESNVPATWAKVRTSISNILEPIRQDGGLISYDVIFDDTTTTQSDIDQHVLNGKVSIVPPKSIEAINVDFQISNQGVTIG